MKAHPVSGFIVAVSSAALVTAALFCAGCLQELPLGDKYLNEAAGFLRVRNTSTQASYVFTGFELRDADGKVVKTWDSLELGSGEIWIEPVDREGSFTLYCTIKNDAEKTVGTFEYGTVSIKLHEVTESKITGEVYLSTADADGDGFSDFWETEKGFNPKNAADGGTVYVSTSKGDDTNPGTLSRPYKSLTKGLAKAKFGLSDEARIVIAEGTFNASTEGTGGSALSLIHIGDTGLHGVTIIGKDASVTIDAGHQKRVIYLGAADPKIARPKLTLKNIKLLNGWAYRGGGVYADGADFILGAGAVIQGCKNGGGVFAFGGASVLMEDGSLIGSYAIPGPESYPNTTESNKSAEGAGVTVYNGSTLTMKRGSKIQGNEVNRTGAVYARLGSQITLEDGALIAGNKLPSDSMDAYGPGGGVRLDIKSKMLMTGGLIVGNVNERGGGAGVYIGDESELNMTGGAIRGNHAKTSGKPVGGVNALPGDGGGVYVDAGGTFNMSGEAIIAGNTATGKGGGVYIAIGGKIYKTGGTIYGSNASTNDKNTAEANGSGHAYLFMTDSSNFLPADNTEAGNVSLSVTY
jgi:hypothetical protein